MFYLVHLVENNFMKTTFGVKFPNSPLKRPRIDTVQGSENRQELVQTKLRKKGLLKEKSFELYRMKLIRGEG